MSFYVKKLYDNELGIRRGKINKAGKFLLLSKKNQIVEFFPYLDSNVVKPSTSIGIIINDTRILVNAEYVYNNQSTGHKGKDRRIYLNEEIDPNGSYFKTNYYIVFFRYYDEGDNEIRYILYRYTPEHKHYDLLEKLTEKKNHLIFEKIDFIDTSDKSFKEVKISKKTNERINDRLKRDEKDIYSNQAEFRYGLREIYNNKCSITGESIDTGNTINCQAAHIKPWQFKGSHSPKNGILLSLDLHWAFDRGCFTIDNKYKIKVFAKMKNGFLRKYDGKKIQLPKDEKLWPSLDNLDFHNKKIFGKLKMPKKGSLII